jgi:hypothetical protein
LRALSSVVPETLKMVKVVSRDVLFAKVQTDNDIYNIGSTVNGQIFLEQMMGIDLSSGSRATYDYVVSFGNSRVAVNNQEISRRGEGLFSFVVPTRPVPTVTNTEIEFTIKYGNLQ